MTQQDKIDAGLRLFIALIYGLTPQLDEQEEQMRIRGELPAKDMEFDCKTCGGRA